MELLSELSPSRYITFTYPHPNPEHENPYTDPLHIAVLDSPLCLSSSSTSVSVPETAAILVPPGQEHDWIFSTLAGHVSLLLSSSSLSRLILIGSVPYPVPKSFTKVPVPDPNPLEDALLPLLLALCPKAAFQQSCLPQVPFLSFDDSAIRVIPKEIIVGAIVGEMIVEDVAIQQSNSDDTIEIRRRLRFKRMPNLIQTQVLLSPSSFSSSSDWLSILESGSVRVEPGSLVQPYLAPMVAGLSLVSPSIMEKFAAKMKPRCLCVGVGGGALLMFLKSQLGFRVVGIETDSIVINMANNHFQLVQDEFLHVCIGDGIEIINKFASKFMEERKSSLQFDAIMIDLDSGDVVSGVNAPPLEFLEKDFLLTVRSIMCDDSGVLVINVIPPNDEGSFVKGIFDVFGGIFAELYRIDVEGDDNFVLFATVCPVRMIEIKKKSEFIRKLEELVGGRLIRRIRKIGIDN